MYRHSHTKQRSENQNKRVTLSRLWKRSAMNNDESNTLIKHPRRLHVASCVITYFGNM